MAKMVWMPTETDANGFPQKKSELTYKGIKEWIRLHGSDEEKAWFAEVVEENTEEIKFYKINESKVKAKFIEKKGLYQEKGTTTTQKPKETPADKLRKEFGVAKKKSK